MKSVSGAYLLVMLQQCAVWTVYAIRIHDPEVLVMNALAVGINAIFLSLFLYVQWQFARYGFMTIVLLSMPLPFLVHLFMTTSHIGLLATMGSIITYAVSLDSVSLTLKSRDPDTVNMLLVVAATINGAIWGVYAILIGDLYIFLPNVAALASSSIQIHLYWWSKGDMDSTHWLIQYL